MNTLWSSVLLLAFTQFVVCRDFYLGMFRRNDFLVAQDVIYKAPSPFGHTTASYGRLFKCPITYFRVVDRLGMGRGPITSIVRGGLKKKYIAVRIKSTYRLPVSVNIYVGCENKQPSTFRTTGVTLTTTSSSASSTFEPIIFVSPDGDTVYSEENNDKTPKNKTTDETPKEEPNDGDAKKEPDDEKKDDGTDTTPKENNDENKDENNDETKPEEEETKPEEEETNPED